MRYGDRRGFEPDHDHHRHRCASAPDALSRLSPFRSRQIGRLIIIAIGAETVLASRFELSGTVDTRLRRGVRIPHRLHAKDAISNRQALALGIALSLNNIGAGVGAGVAGVPPLATSLLAGALH